MDCKGYASREFSDRFTDTSETTADTCTWGVVARDAWQQCRRTNEAPPRPHRAARRSAREPEYVGDVDARE